MPHPADDAPRPRALEVSVERTGGIGGLTRRWSVSADGEQAAAWWSLVSACPWESAAAAPADTRGADRFQWVVTVSEPSGSVPGAAGDTPRRAELGETQAGGPWRTLIDAVRAAETPPAEPGSPSVSGGAPSVEPGSASEE